MGELKVKVSDKVERLFRKLAMERFGYQKGAISGAAEEAFQNWTFNYSDEKEIDDPLEAITGLMKGIKKTSVELQHEAWDYIADKYKKKSLKKNVN